MLDYIEEILEKEPDSWVTVRDPGDSSRPLVAGILHNQRALLSRRRCCFKIASS